MTAREHLNARPAAIQPSLRRAPTRNAEVRSNSDHDLDNAPPKIPNRPSFSHRHAVRAPRTVAPRPFRTTQAICRPLKSHR
jgi:hypothetical protein